MNDGGEEDELEKLRCIFESNDTKISSHKRWKMKDDKTKEIKTPL